MENSVDCYHNLLVTGGAGFIGSSFVAQAVAKGHQVIVLDALTYAGHKENLQWIDVSPSGGSYTLVEGNICDGRLVKGLLEEHNINAVVNFAAESHVDNSISGPGEFVETNINGTYSLLEASRQYWKSLSKEKRQLFRFLQISTDEVFGSLELDSPDKFSENTPYAPSSPYSASKAAGDHLLHAWHKTYGMPTVLTNCTNNYGPRQYPEKLIPLMVTRALAKQSLPVYGDGKNVRDWIHVEDHCRGVYLALTKGEPGQTYCLGGDAERNNLEIVHAICNTLEQLVPHEGGRNYESLITFVPDRPGHDRRYAMDSGKAEQALGFTRNYTFEDGLKSTLEWYLENTAWCEAVTGKEEAA